jgi:hypothetical protein
LSASVADDSIFVGIDSGGDGGKVAEGLYVIVGRGKAAVNGDKSNSNVIVILVY